MRLLMLLVLLLPVLSFGSPDSQEVQRFLKQMFEENKVEAEQGDANAQYTLAIKYVNGWGVPKDEKEAVKWLRLAAEQGDVDALFRLPVMLERGDGVPKDDKEAVKWYRLAAD